MNPIGSINISFPPQPNPRFFCLSNTSVTRYLGPCHSVAKPIEQRRMKVVLALEKVSQKVIRSAIPFVVSRSFLLIVL